MFGHAELFGIVGAVLASVSFIPYIISMVRGRTKPSRVTWSLWAISAFLILVLYVFSDEPVGWTILLPIVYFFGQGTVALLSLKYGVRGWTRLDVVCLMSGLISIVLWIIFHDPLVSLFLLIGSDFFGALPTIRKSYSGPQSEDTLTWFLTTLGDFCLLLAVESATLFVVAFPLYLFVINGLITILTLRKFFFSPKRLNR